MSIDKTFRLRLVLELQIIIGQLRLLLPENSCCFVFFDYKRVNVLWFINVCPEKNKKKKNEVQIKIFRITTSCGLLFLYLETFMHGHTKLYLRKTTCKIIPNKYTPKHDYRYSQRGNNNTLLFIYLFLLFHCDLDREKNCIICLRINCTLKPYGVNVEEELN